MCKFTISLENSQPTVLSEKEKGGVNCLIVQKSFFHCLLSAVPVEERVTVRNGGRLPHLH
jgi:hypothetical protein